MEERKFKKPNRKNPRRLVWIIALEVFILIVIFGAYQLLINNGKTSDTKDNSNSQDEVQGSNGKDEGTTDTDPADDTVEEEEGLSQEEKDAIAEQDRLKQEDQDRKELVAKADRLAMGYDYDGAIDLIKSYQGSDGGYQVYTYLMSAIDGYAATKSTLVLLGGSYDSVTQINHIFFHSLIADNSKAFDGDDRETGYNMYMTTVSEFEKIMQKMYDDGYVLASIHDLAKQVTAADGTTEFQAGEIYLPEGKKPFVLSQDDVNYYEYMTEDGFASRIVIGEDGKPTCEMIMDDGSTVTGLFDMIPIVDAFVELHPDFSYRGAKGIIAETGYEGTLGYRTDDPTSPTYEADKETVKKVAEAMKADGWEFASHSWGHRKMQEKSYDFVVNDMNRWLEEVGSLVGPTDILIFPNGNDIETTMGTYSSDKYKFLKEKGFNFYCGVYEQPWMHLKKDYVRMTRRPLDGQAMIQFPDRVVDLYDPVLILDPDRPERNWE